MSLELCILTPIILYTEDYYIAPVHTTLSWQHAHLSWPHCIRNWHHFCYMCTSHVTRLVLLHTTAAVICVTHLSELQLSPRSAVPSIRCTQLHMLHEQVIIFKHSHNSMHNYNSSVRLHNCHNNIKLRALSHELLIVHSSLYKMLSWL